MEKSPDYLFYIDDSGSRDPDRSRTTDTSLVDWFGMGGVLVREDQLEGLKQQILLFRSRWPHPDAPLHSSEIRTRKNRFAWLRNVSQSKHDRFMAELTELMCSLPIIVHAAVVDRPGYNRKYMKEYGPRRWSLCQTAFKIAVERAAKFALSENARLRVFVEQSDRPNERRLKSYFEELRSEGTGFKTDTSAKYAPLTVEQLSGTLVEFRTKTKQSLAMQIADLALWPVCKGRYFPDNLALVAMTRSGKLLDAKCLADNGLLGIKYSCFD
ncbi:conserved hypothetical protein [Burkholderiales bacterium 8X]|nr:conserved hypothetical protein [Burkholderiales bacterium 8X]